MMMSLTRPYEHVLCKFFPYLYLDKNSTATSMAPTLDVASKWAIAVEKLRLAMGHCGHLTYRGQVYRLEEGAKYTYVPLTSPETYVDQLLKNPSVGPYLLDHDVRLARLLAKTDNPICDEVVIDYDLIEVSLCSFGN